MTNKKRIEFDSIGSKKIDKNRLWGAQTQRSLENFQIVTEKMPNELIVALGKQKKAAALANVELGVLNQKLGSRASGNVEMDLPTSNDPGTVGGSSRDSDTGGTFGSSVDDVSTFSDYS